MVDEAALAFELNSGLLTILDTEAPVKEVDEPVEIVLEPPSVESTYSLSSVAAVVGAGELFSAQHSIKIVAV